MTAQHLRRLIFSSKLYKCRSFTTAGNEFKENKVTLKDFDINYLKVGNGPHNLILLPGSLGSIWSHFEPQLKNLDKEKFTIVAFDPPGYGKSIPPERQYPLDFLEKDADIALLLMRALDLPLFSLAGWSDGGITGMILSAKYPENVKKSVIWGANSYILPTELKCYENIRDLSKWSKRMKDPLIQLYGEEYFTKIWNGWCDAMQNIFNEKKGNLCMEVLPKIKCPTFVLYGEKDPLVDKSHLPMLHMNIKDCEMHRYPEGKHDIHLKYAEDFNKRITEFLLK